MGWVQDCVQSYLEKTATCKISYSNFLHTERKAILDNKGSADDWTALDGSLFGEFKARLPKDAPHSALRRLTVKSFFWDLVLDEQADRIAQNYEADALELLDESRGKARARLKRRFNR